jgi:hypothetical protein
MSEQECIDELLAKGWRRYTFGDFRSPKGWWTIERTPMDNWRLRRGDEVLARGGTLPELVRAEMPDSAAVTVATYFGLRAPGVV